MYSMLFVPVTPAVVVLMSFSTLGSYTSKSFGKFTSGFFTNFTLPLPVIFNLIVTASSVFTRSELISAFMLKVPTALAKEAGLPEGNDFTSIVTGAEVNVLLTSR